MGVGSGEWDWGRVTVRVDDGERFVSYFERRKGGEWRERRR